MLVTTTSNRHKLQKQNQTQRNNIKKSCKTSISTDYRADEIKSIDEIKTIREIKMRSERVKIKQSESEETD